MGPKDVVSAWGKILLGYTPTLSIEITRECPLRCPGCYAYGADHLGGGLTLREVSDFRGQALVDGVLALVAKHRPLHVSLVGGEPLVRYRELDVLLPSLAARGLNVQVVTSGVRPLPIGWREIPRLNISVSVDGLPAEHDVRRAPATYDRILKHIDGHAVTIHCTVTRQQAQRDGYLAEFVHFWSAQPATKRIWMSLYTPQVGEQSPERLFPEDRDRAIAELLALRARYPKLEMPASVIRAYAQPPADPGECIFSRVTHTISADLATAITPCQFGGRPDCASCGCMASAALAAVGHHRLLGLLPVSAVFDASLAVGTSVRAVRERGRRSRRQTGRPAGALARTAEASET